MLSIACASVTTCEAVGSNYSFRRGGFVLRTIDSGRRWSLQRLPVGIVDGVACSSVTNCEAVGTDLAQTTGVALGTTPTEGEVEARPVWIDVREAHRNGARRGFQSRRRNDLAGGSGFCADGLPSGL